MVTLMFILMMIMTMIMMMMLMMFLSASECVPTGCLMPPPGERRHTLSVYIGLANIIVIVIITINIIITSRNMRMKIIIRERIFIMQCITTNDRFFLRQIVAASKQAIININIVIIINTVLMHTSVNLLASLSSIIQWYFHILDN